MIEVKGSSGAAFSLEFLPDGQVQFSNEDIDCDVRQIGPGFRQIGPGPLASVRQIGPMKQKKRDARREARISH